MLIISLLILCAQVIASQYAPYPKVPDKDEGLIDGTFPDDFLLGAASAAYQIEGAWNKDGKSPSIWDTLVHQYTDGKNPVVNNETADVACSSYENWRRDIEMLTEIKAKVYRFSVAWTRIIPNGVGAVNQAGIDYYNGLIDALIAVGIKPAVTMSHWDLPQALEDQGGWLNEYDAIDWFGNYSDVLYQHFGDKVKLWLTINEPWTSAVLAYGGDGYAPNDHTDFGKNTYRAAKSFIHSHARAWHVYNDKYRATQKGQVGWTMNVGYAIPNDTREETLDACQRSMQFGLGWFANALYSDDGNWPQVMIDVIGNKSVEGGFTESRLPAWTSDEIVYLKGASDFIGLNYYTSSIVFNSPSKGTLHSNYYSDSNTGSRRDPDWPKSGSSWLFVVPYGLRNLLNYVKSTYGAKWPIYVFENGVSDNNGTVNDPWRTTYMTVHLNQVLKAINIDGVNVKGYTAWSVMDNFEWLRGYSEKFGLYSVDFNDPDRPRMAKDSAKALAVIYGNNGWPGAPTGKAPDGEMTRGKIVGLLSVLGLMRSEVEKWLCRLFCNAMGVD